MKEYLNRDSKEKISCLLATKVYVENLLQTGGEVIPNWKVASPYLLTAQESMHEALVKVFEEISPDQVKQIEDFNRSHKVTVVSDVSHMEYQGITQFIASELDVMTIVKHAQDYECLVCDKDKNGCKNCDLRLAMARIGINRTGNSKFCEYRDGDDYATN